MVVSLFNSVQANSIQWENYQAGSMLRPFFETLLQTPIDQCVRNGVGTMQLLALDDALIPIQIISGQAPFNSAYICAPSGQYVHLAIEEIEKEVNTSQVWYQPLAKPFLQTFGAMAKRTGFDQVVQIDQWLLSTNLHHPLRYEALQTATHHLAERFPQHALVFRSVSDLFDQDLAAHLQALGYQPVVSRKIYALDTTLDRAFVKKRMSIADQKLWQKQQSQYHWEVMAQADCCTLNTLRQFYEALYRQKYTQLNPAYTPLFLQKAHAARLLTFHLLRHTPTNALAGFSAFFERNGILTTPLIGYDPALPPEAGIYRFLHHRAVQEALTRNLKLHLSSGAGQFKTLRGAMAGIEYHWVYTRHLPWKRRLPWQVMQALTRYVAVPTLQKHIF